MKTLKILMTILPAVLMFAGAAEGTSAEDLRSSLVIQRGLSGIKDNLDTLKEQAATLKTLGEKYFTSFENKLKFDSAGLAYDKLKEKEKAMLACYARANGFNTNAESYEKLPKSQLTAKLPEIKALYIGFIRAMHEALSINSLVDDASLTGPSCFKASEGQRAGRKSGGARMLWDIERAPRGTVGTTDESWFEIPAVAQEERKVEKIVTPIATPVVAPVIAIPEEITFACEFTYPMSDAGMKNYPKTIDREKCKSAYSAASQSLQTKWSKAARMMQGCEKTQDPLRSMAKGLLISMLATGKIVQGNFTFNSQTTVEEAIKKFGEFEGKMKSCKVQ